MTMMNPAHRALSVGNRRPFDLIAALSVESADHALNDCSADAKAILCCAGAQFIFKPVMTSQTAHRFRVQARRLTD